MKTELSYFCDYALISPPTVANRIEKAIENTWCSWTDLDDDRFELRVYHPFKEEKEFTKEECKQIDEIINPYLYVDPEIRG